MYQSQTPVMVYSHLLQKKPHYWLNFAKLDLVFIDLCQDKGHSDPRWYNTTSVTF